MIYGIAPSLPHLIDATITHPSWLTFLLIVFQFAALAFIANQIAKRFTHEYPAAAHRIYILAVVMALALLPLHLWFGGWSVKVAATDQSVAVTTLQDRFNKGPSDGPAPPTHEAVIVNTPVDSSSDTPSPARREDSAEDSQGNAETKSQIMPESVATVPTKEQFAANSNARPTFSWLTFLIGSLWFIYISGAMLFATRCAVSFVQLQHIHARGSSPTEAQQSLTRRAADALMLKKLPELRLSPQITIPMVTGLLRPKVLLPHDFEQWSHDERWMTLLHELTHIERRDMVGQCFVMALRVLYWFHPASHFLDRKVAEAREWATDQQVIRSGISASEYADCLLSIVARASGCHRPATPTPFVIPMCAEKLEERLLRVCNGNGKENGSAMIVPMALLVMLASLAITTIRLDRATAQEAQAPLTDAKPAAALNHDPSVAAKEGDLVQRFEHCELMRAAGDSIAKLITIQGRITSENGEPVPGATVLLRESGQRFLIRMNPPPQPFTNKALPSEPRFTKVIAKTRTDAHGRYEFREIKAPVVLDASFDRWRGNVAAMHPDFGAGAIVLRTSDKASFNASDVDIKLRQFAKITGYVKTPEGVPVRDAEMSLASFEIPGEGLPQAFEEFELWKGQLEPRTRTNAQGYFEFPNVPRGYVASVLMLHPDWLFKGVRVATDSDVSPGKYQFRTGESEVVASPCEFIVDKGTLLRGTVNDSDGNSVANARISVMSFTVQVLTNEQGAFEYRLSNQVLASIKNTPDHLRRVSIYPPPDSHLLPQIVNLALSEQTAEQTVQVRLPKGVVVRGRVVTNNFKGVPNITVFVPGIEPFVDTKTDDEGRFKLTLPQSENTILLFGSDSGGWKLPNPGELYRQGAQNTIDPAYQIKVDLRNQPNAELPPFQISKHESIRVQAVLADGSPAIGAAVVLKDTIESKISSRANFNESVERSAVQFVDQNGIVELVPTGLISDRATVEVVYAGADKECFGSARCSDANEGVVVVKLADNWIITGRVLLNGKPISGAQVDLSQSVAINTREGPQLGGSISRMQVRTMTNEEGHYTASVPRGFRYSVMVASLPPFPDYQPGIGYYPSGSDKDVLTVRDFNFQTGKESIEGRVVDSAGNPIAGMHVQVRSSLSVTPNLWYDHFRSSQLETDNDGKFALRNMPAGEYVLDISRRNTGPNRYASTSVTAKTGIQDLNVVFVNTESKKPIRIKPQRIEKIASSGE